ncbi:hypothetical protein GCM10022407_17750 [Hymenobacter antarcticus]|uniref:DUF4239 domain-containing protein n=2 Tax=Hymenobacter antarcticus TaxID=486270 RepID=A0ABP7PWJ4_9BACT
MLYTTHTTLLVSLLFGALLVFTGIGLRVGKWRSAYATATDEQSVAVASLLALQGLLLAFTFAMAGTRFEARRGAIIDVATSLHTAILRADLYPAAERQGFRQDLRQYLESRIRYAESPREKAPIAAALAQSEFYAQRLWARTVRLSPEPEYQIATEQMIAALNTVFEHGLARQASLRARVPDPIVYMLFIISLATAFFTGYVGTNRRKFDWLAVAVFHLLVGLVVYITLDLDRPRRGLIRTTDMQELFTELRQQFRPERDSAALPLPAAGQAPHKPAAQ